MYHKKPEKNLKYHAEINIFLIRLLSETLSVIYQIICEYHILSYHIFLYLRVLECSQGVAKFREFTLPTMIRYRGQTTTPGTACSSL